MIKVNVYRNDNNDIFRFNVENHGTEIVCAAVSILVLNTANAIEAFTEDKFFYEYNDEGGFFRITCPDIELNKHSHDVNLLLNTLLLGLKGIEEQYSDSISINDDF